MLPALSSSIRFSCSLSFPFLPRKPSHRAVEVQSHCPPKETQPRISSVNLLDQCHIRRMIRGNISTLFACLQTIELCTQCCRLRIHNPPVTVKTHHWIYGPVTKTDHPHSPSWVSVHLFRNENSRQTHLTTMEHSLMDFLMGLFDKVWLFAAVVIRLLRSSSSGDFDLNGQSPWLTAVLLVASQGSRSSLFGSHTICHLHDGFK